MPFFELKEIPGREIVPGFTARFVHSQFMTFSYWEVKAGAVLPEHSHPHEQVANLLSGKFEMTVAGETRVLEPGMVAVIPPEAKHSGRALADCYILDVFYPVREDYR
ncbi:MAG TPA: cupin domain-containing protein [Syntrophales bacterium]|mgnify:FL=1|jgi:quercetin dioxygenase-like cupin family protein|nr:cupin domain-containing protein [Syntrophales bacterium]HON23973.1 cupin domain-containing protein [Syntrophales bacterium]HOU78757.1 cupin domain-containing protein [Syntrophales bacterium]HPC33837.1 cupin domain-containing protein [Syntrophales bacterium]HQG35554.1 cupin domain-containing protein [Syntrophales bacterium]